MKKLGRLLSDGWFWAYAALAVVSFPIWWFMVRMLWTASVAVVTTPCAELFLAMCRK